MKKKYVIILISSMLAVGALAAVFIVPHTISSVRYEKAKELLAAGAYREALAAFEEIESFRDSGQKTEKLKKYLIPYQDAENLLAEGDFERAVEAFEELGEYENSPEKALEAAYALAETYFQNAEYAEALAVFRELGEKNYSDSGQRAEDTMRYIRYNSALAELEKQNFTKAYEEFDSLGDFLDCLDKLIEVDEAYWRYTDARDAMEAYALYLKFPGANHKTEAEAGYERLFSIEQTEMAAREFEKASHRNTVTALDSFFAAWENSPYAAAFLELAEIRIGELLNDGSLSAPILEEPNSATQAAIEAFLTDYPGHKDEAKIRGLIEGDIFALTESGVIELYITGDAIDYTTARLKNKSSRNMTVIIPTGAYFVSNSGGVQNMAVRETKTVTIKANDSASVSIPTACMNIDKAIPDSDNGFKLATLGADSKLARVMALLEVCNASYYVAQAAVWIITDNPNEYDLLNTLVYLDGSPAISIDDLAKAREIAGEA